MQNREALSLEQERIMDSFEAYDLYHIGEIVDPKKFECPHDGCEAKGTLSSIKNRSERKQMPHFRFYGAHKQLCPYGNDYLGSDTEKVDTDSLENRTTSGMDILELDKFKRTVTTAGGGQSTGFDPNETKKRYRGNLPRAGNRDRNYYTIRVLVKKYEEYKVNGILPFRYLKIQGKKITYLMAFKEISDDATLYPGVKQIYFGDAQISKNSKGDYVISFENEVYAEGEKIRPSAYISQTIIDESYLKNQWRKELDELSESKETSSIFILGSPRIHNSGTKKYLNIMIERGRLDFVEML